MKKYIRYIFLSVPLLATNACTDLEENVYSEVVSENYYNNALEIESAVARPYTHASAWVTSSGQNGWWRLSELSGDQLAWPQKGPHGYDNGNWIRLHYHTWQESEGTMSTMWQLLWTGWGYCTDPIQNLEALDIDAVGITEAQRQAYIAELKLFQAFHYVRLIDLWGNVPIVTEIGEPSPLTKSRVEVFNFTENLILENINAANKLSGSTIGRMTKAGAFAMLVELYLNAEEWTGTSRWDECIQYADSLISGNGGGQNGTMQLDPNITDQFKPTNETSLETIFSIAYDGTVSTPPFNADFFHFNQKYIYGGNKNGNDGIVLIPGVYDKYSDDDLRKSEWLLIGPMYYYTDPTEPVVGYSEYLNEPLVFVDNIRRNSELATGQDPETLESTMTKGEENSGVRFNKYKLGATDDDGFNGTDWNVYRLTWIYFAKAEALMRQNGNVATQEAVDLINTCRVRCFDASTWSSNQYTTTTLTMDELLEERGREFIFEGYRRQDLIRFGKFLTTDWWDHTATNDDHLKLFPIPLSQLSLNDNLAQNDGYLDQ